MFSNKPILYLVIVLITQIPIANLFAQPCPNPLRPLEAGYLREGKSYCPGERVTVSNFKYARGGVDRHTYFWQQRLPGGEWETILGRRAEIPNFYSPWTITETTEFRRGVSDNCSTAYTDPITIEIYGPTAGGSISGEQSICHGTVPSLITSEEDGQGSPQLTYRWRSRGRNSRWRTIDKATEASYQPGVLTETTYFHRLVESGCKRMGSNTIKVEVSPELIAGSIYTERDRTCSGADGNPITSSKGSSGGIGTHHYQWEVLKNDTWEIIPGANEANYSPGSLTEPTSFRRSVTDDCNLSVTNTVTLDVYSAIDAGSIGPNQSIKWNSTPYAIRSITPGSGGSSQASYQWQQSTDNQTWTNIDRARGEFHQPWNVQLTQDTWYRRIYKNSQCGEMATYAIKVTVAPIKPANLTASMEVPHRVSLSWEDQSNNEEGFKLWRSRNHGKRELVATLPANTTYFVDQKADPKTNYDYWISSYRGDEDGESESELIGPVDINTLPALTPEAELEFTPQYNGNIAAIKWKTASQPEEQRYNFHYDPMNRLTDAQYVKKSQNGYWDAYMGAHNMTAEYDMNGNITHMYRQQTVDELIAVTDKMIYEYMGNQLKNVTDESGDNRGFKDDTEPNDDVPDYTYDANGNLTSDKNKGITQITYNYLNLPEKVIYKETEEGIIPRIEYVYDAAGVKHRQHIYEQGGDTPTKTIDYVGEVIYETLAGEETKLKMIQHEEGRIVIPEEADGNVEEGVYEYHLKDHLGNVRLTFTTEPTSWEYPATLETEDAEIDGLFYINIEETRHTDLVSDHNPNNSDEENEVARVDGRQVIGPTTTLEVGPYDQITATVYGYYTANNGHASTVNPASILGALSSAYQATTGLSEASALFTESNNDLLAAVVGGSRGDKAPAAYLNYLYFNQHHQFIRGGHQAIPEGAGIHHLITLNDIPIFEKAGYVMVYVSYEGTTHYVDFDDLSVTHTESPIVQSEDYYPFGLSFNQYQRVGDQENRFKFNSKEENVDLGLEWIDFGARMYMKDLSKWGTLDPLADRFPKYTPYGYAVNNPVLFIDPDGQSPLNIVNAEGVITRAFAHLMHLATGMSKQTINSTIIEFDSNNPIHPHRNLTGYRAGAITLYNRIIFTDNFDTPQGSNLADSRGYVRQWFNILPHELGHRVQSDALTLYLTNYVGQALWTMAREGSVNSSIIHDKILMEQEAEKYQKDFNAFIQFFNFKDDDGRQNKIIDLFSGGIKDQDALIEQLDKYYREYQNAKEEENRRSEGAKSLLNDASSGSLEAGTYIWNGSTWVKQYSTLK